jgi:hypothetical protein
MEEPAPPLPADLQRDVAAGVEAGARKVPPGRRVLAPPANEEPASWSLAVFFIQRGSFIVGEIVHAELAMVAAVGVGEKMWAQPLLKY